MDGSARPNTKFGTTRPYTAPDWAALACVMLFAWFALWMTTGGYDGSDDRYYLQAADGWLAHPPFLGTKHWHVRYPLVLAQAASIGVFGRNETALLLPAALSYFGIVLLSFVLLRRYAGTLAGAVSGLLIAATPVVTIYGKVSFPDEPEAVLALLSLFLFLRGTERWSPWWFLGAGLALGVAWADRISISSLLFLYFVLFLAGWGVSRIRYAWLGMGAALPVLVMFGFVTVVAGSPLWKLRMDESSLETYSAHMIGGVANGLRPPFSWRLMAKWVPNSPIDVHWAVNPFLDLAINPQHGGLVVLGVLLTWPLLRRYRGETALGRFLRLVLLWGALILFTVLMFLNLRPMPRYFLTLTWVGAAVVAVFVAEVRGRWRAPVLLCLAGLLALDLVAAAMRPDDIFVERALVRYLQENPQAGPVTTTPGIFETAEFLLQEHGLADRVRVGTATDGLWFDDGRHAHAGWPVVWREEQSTPALLRLIPEAVRRRLRPGGPDAVVQQVTSAPAP